MKTKDLISEFKTILLNDFYNNRAKLIDNMKIISKSPSGENTNKYEKIFIEESLNFLTKFKMEEDEKLFIENKKTIKENKVVRKKFNKDKRASEITQNIALVIQSKTDEWSENPGKVENSNFDQINKELHGVQDISYLFENQDEMDLYINQLVAGLYIAIKKPEKYASPLMRMMLAFGTYIDTIKIKKASKLLIKIDNYENWMNEEINNDYRNEQFKWLVNKLKYEDKLENEMDFMLPLFRNKNFKL